MLLELIEDGGREHIGKHGHLGIKETAHGLAKTGCVLVANGGPAPSTAWARTLAAARSMRVSLNTAFAGAGQAGALQVGIDQNAHELAKVDAGAPAQRCSGLAGVGQQGRDLRGPK